MPKLVRETATRQKLSTGTTAIASTRELTLVQGAKAMTLNAAEVGKLHWLLAEVHAEAAREAARSDDVPPPPPGPGPDREVDRGWPSR